MTFCVEMQVEARFLGIFRRIMENLSQWLSCQVGTWFNKDKYDEHTSDYYHKHLAFGRYIFLFGIRNGIAKHRCIRRGSVYHTTPLHTSILSPDCVRDVVVWRRRRKKLSIWIWFRFFDVFNFIFGGLNYEEILILWREYAFGRQLFCIQLLEGCVLYF